MGSYVYGAPSPGNCRAGTWATKPHAVQQAGSSNTYSYGCNGNMTVRTIGGVAYTLTYDAENRLTGISDGVTASYVYDGDGNRVKETIAGVMRVFIGNYYEVDNGAVKKYYDAGSVRMAESSGGALYYLLSDHLGSIALTLDSAGNRLNTNTEIRYYPYGAPRYTAGATPTTFNFTGQRRDGGSGLLYYGARWYDPVVGRFISADTIVPQPGNPQSLNRYSYVGNQPTVSIDPSGHAACAAGDTACWQEEWRWKDRWYKAHGHTGGNWFGSPDDPEFEDEQILRETVGEAGISIAGVWDFASQLIPMATGIIRFGNRLSGGLAHLRGLLGGGAQIKPGSCFGHPCALPPGTDTVSIPNSIHDATWLKHTVVHELAHIIDWHSHMLTGVGPYGNPMYGHFSDIWNEKPLTNYAAQSHFYPARWDVWAEAVMVWVFSDKNTSTGIWSSPDIQLLSNIDLLQDLAPQMDRLADLIGGR